MSQISAFGIGAGRTIAGESDEDDERLRQRRLTAMQRTEQARRGAALRERFEQSERAHTMLAAQQHAKQQRADNDMRDAQAAARQKLPSNPLPAQSMPDRVPARPAGIYHVKKFNDEKVAILTPPRPDASEEQPLHPDAMTKRSIAAAEDRLAGDSRLADFPEPVVAQANSDEAGTANPAGQLMRLADDLAAFRGPEFADKLAARLDTVLSAMRSHPTPIWQPAEADELYATLEFIEGYVEVASIGGGGQQKLLQLIGELRQQLLGFGPTAPGLQPPVAVAAVISQMSSDKGRVCGVTEVRANVRLKPSVVERRAETDYEAEIELEINAALTESSRLSPGGPVRTSQSSLSKDAEKRQAETPVTVTVRSV